MNKDDKKAAVAAYKERKSVAGIFAVRCIATSEVWVGQSPNLDKAQNRIWFTLRMGASTYRTLQPVWNAQDEKDFAFDVLEEIDDEPDAYTRKKILADRAAFWRDKLGGREL